MSQGNVEDLFGGGEGQPEPRTRLVAGLLSVGLISAMLGMLCTAAPGGVLVLLGWMVVEKDQDRLHTGYLPEESRGTVQRLRVAAWVSVLCVIVLFFAQALLFCSGFYEELWSNLLRWYVGG